MCGLAFWLQFHTPTQWRDCAEVFPEALVEAEAFAAAAAALPRRGPDSEGESLVELSGGELHLRACVLHLRGDCVVSQPCPVESKQEEAGLLLFNGEAYEVLPGASGQSHCQELEGEEFGAAINLYRLRAGGRAWRQAAGQGLQLAGSDTLWLAARMAALEDATPGRDWEPLAAALRGLLQGLHGPFALALWCPRRRAVFVARDRLGRRSLVAARSACGGCIASAPGGAADKWKELPVTGIFVFHLSEEPSVHHVPWEEPVAFEQSWWWGSAAAAPAAPLATFGELLASAVALRVLHVAQLSGGAKDVPHVGLLFSGGLDSTVLAALTAEALPGHTIELLNVAFDSSAPDRLTALCSYEDLVGQYGPQRFRLVLCDITQQEVYEEELAICRLVVYERYEGQAAEHIHAESRFQPLHAIPDAASSADVPAH
ncbi:unnamed protein product [Symbiodinium natans]|uniref:Glutamine amidotransferase type-2 domain-containing protein n=1 Tax=Symbiodinium natans TaxID=878477 RepID=A0A812RZ12_9DINO|nr:unnamed protein product [Symbiodinium natans]